eukprot:TRINITY_DN6130_c0_g1_i1.p1 TRINITY_DN6130_c0_g1~~TRINITY_DN6130_c0_g1_i1.p1  ORF type:complete len:441 (-),score=101.38 TRINITY_DN6130_c0_g1_i1:836-2119(-)
MQEPRVRVLQHAKLVAELLRWVVAAEHTGGACGTNTQAGAQSDVDPAFVADDSLASCACGNRRARALTYLASCSRVCLAWAAASEVVYYEVCGAARGRRTCAALEELKCRHENDASCRCANCEYDRDIALEAAELRSLDVTFCAEATAPQIRSPRCCFWQQVYEFFACADLFEPVVRFYGEATISNIIRQVAGYGYVEVWLLDQRDVLCVNRVSTTLQQLLPGCPQTATTFLFCPSLNRAVARLRLARARCTEEVVMTVLPVSVTHYRCRATGERTQRDQILIPRMVLSQMECEVRPFLRLQTCVGLNQPLEYGVDFVLTSCVGSNEEEAQLTLFTGGSTGVESMEVETFPSAMRNTSNKQNIESIISTSASATLNSVSGNAVLLNKQRNSSAPSTAGVKQQKGIETLHEFDHVMQDTPAFNNDEHP